MNDALKKLLKPLAGLRLTVALMAFSMLLIFCATWAQIDKGIWAIVTEYFRSFVVWVPFQVFLPRDMNVPGGLPIPGGYVLGPLLLLNLLAAHATRFRMKAEGERRIFGLCLLAFGVALLVAFHVMGGPRELLVWVTEDSWLPKILAIILAGICRILIRITEHPWLPQTIRTTLLYGMVYAPMLAAVYVLFAKRSGIILIHGAMILLIVGEAITGNLAIESQMPIYEGQTINWTHDIREVELAVMQHDDSNTHTVHAIPASRLVKAARSDDKDINVGPLQVRVEQYFTNSEMMPRTVPVDGMNGLGRIFEVKSARPVTGVGEQQVDYPAAVVSVWRDNAMLGRWLLSPHFNPRMIAFLLQRNPAQARQAIGAFWPGDQVTTVPQSFRVGDQTFELALRFRRHYKPYQVQLTDFKHDLYTGTQVPKNFSSDIRLIDPSRSEDRNVLIYMNHPLRYRGETFFQSGWLGDDFGTILQVVDNPGWQIPYIACILGGLGLLIHFGLHLWEFLQKIRGVRWEGAPRPGLWPALVGAAVCVMYLAIVPFRGTTSSAYDLETFGRTPVSYKGRVKPMDSVARDVLLVLSNRQELRYDDQKIPATQWLLDTLTGRDEAMRYRVFRIADPQVVEHLGLTPRSDHRYSAEDLAPKHDELQRQAQAAAHKQPRDRDAFDRNMLDLGTKVRSYENLFMELHPVPPTETDADWTTIAHAAQHRAQTSDAATTAQVWIGVLKAYHDEKPDEFNRQAAAYSALLDRVQPVATGKATLETFFNRVAPFYQGMVLYVMAGLLACFSWLQFGRTSHWLRNAAVGILLVTLLLHTAGLIGRIYISGRPPVTNLYSSAVFIGWGVVVACLILERIFRTGIATVVAALAGFVTLLIAHHLARSGDTMAVLVAVLDTNIWLATHVIIVTIGYAATYLAGLLGAVYIIKGLFTPTLRAEDDKLLGQMIYGVVCFALLGSFVGTVLGGIWADQSWGRFWGWDPKENGALLIVLWNALILHARWAGVTRTRGMAALAVGGNIVTSWSWFGTNMLGVGLHSYGFIDSALFWLSLFIASQLLIIAAACVPLRYWRSFATPQPVKSPTGRGAKVART